MLPRIISGGGACLPVLEAFLRLGAIHNLLSGAV
jgi:hypothetical protein